MSGKHDKGLDDEQEAKLLLTGPIVIRGLRRGVKEALRPGKPSRHRAFIASGEAEGLGVTESALSPDGPTTQDEATGATSFAQGQDLDQTGTPDGLEEDRVEDRRADDEAPIAADGEASEEPGSPAAAAGDDVAPRDEPEADAEGSDEAAVAPIADESVVEFDPTGVGGDLELTGPDASQLDERGGAQTDGDEAPEAAADPPETESEHTSDGETAADDGAAIERVDADAPDDGADPFDAFSSEDALVEERSDPDGVEPVDEPPSAETGAGSDDTPEAAETSAEHSSGEPEEDPGSPDVVDEGEPVDERPSIETVDPVDEGASVQTESDPDATEGLAESLDEQSSGEPEEDLGSPDVVEDGEPGDGSSSIDEVDPIQEGPSTETGSHADDAEGATESLDERPDDAEREPTVADAEPLGIADPFGAGVSDEAHPAEPDGIVPPEPSSDLDGEVEPTEAADEIRSVGPPDVNDDPSPFDPDEGVDSGADAVEAVEPDGVLDAAASSDEDERVDSVQPNEPSDDEPEPEQGNPDEPGDATEPANDVDRFDGTRSEAGPDVVDPDEQVPSDEDLGATLEGDLHESPDSSVDVPDGEVDSLAAAVPVDEEVGAEPRDEADPTTDGQHVDTDTASSDDAPLAEQGIDTADPAGEAASSGVLPSEADVAATEPRIELTAAAEPQVESDGADAGADNPDGVESFDDDAAPSTEDEPVAGSNADDAALAAFLGAREWTTAEELFSRPIPVQAAAAPVKDPSSNESTAVDTAEGEQPRNAPPEEVEDRDPDSEQEELTSTEPEPEPTPVTAVAATPVLKSGSNSGGRPPRGPRSPVRRSRPIRERFGREAIGIAVLVVLALICGGLITAVVIKTQKDAALAASEAADYTPPPLATPTPIATGPVVAVIGDGATSTAASGVTTAQRWSALVGTALSGTVDTDASSGMGYAAKGGSGETFVQAAAKVPSNADVVVVFGGAADSDVAPLSVLKAATDTLAAIKEQAPDAKVIVVGPAISAGVSAGDLTSIRNTLRTASRIAKATWVDPFAEGWLPSAKQAASSPSALTAADEKTIAAKMEAVITKALG